MKRPSGFDRLPPEPPEERRPEPPEGPRPEPPEGPRPEPLEGRRPEPSEAPKIPGERPSRWSTRTERRRPSTRAAARADADLAETVDLAEVRGPRGETPAVPAAPGPSSGLARALGVRAADPIRAAERRVRDATRRRKASQRRERRRFTAAARRRRRNWFIALGAVAALAVFVAVGAFTPLMAVRQVEVAGASSVNAADVEEALSRFDGRPLALVQNADVHRALEPFPAIQRYAVELVPPHTLRVRIEERVPVISLEEGGSFRLYDAAGVLLGSADAPPEGVPLGTGSLADRGSEAFTAAATVLRDVPAELRAQVVGVTATTAQDVTLGLSSGVQVFWGDALQNRRKAQVLTTMLSSLGDRPIQQIDVSSTEAPVFK